MRKIFSLFAALTLSVGLWAETVSYLYPVYKTDGVATSGIKEWKSTTADATVVTSSSTAAVHWGTAGETTWFVVKGTDVQLTKGAVCAGDVRLILADNAKLTAKATTQNAGIQVSNGNSLTIYAQSTGTQMGQLIAECSTLIGDAAGIGGSTHIDGSNITINGGIITATGGKNGAAGIGGGKGGSGSNITINGGTVEAKADDNTYSGIGGGGTGSGSNIFVATSLQVKADDNNPPTTVITNTGADLASSLAGQQYVTIALKPKGNLTVESFVVSDNNVIYNGEAKAATVEFADGVIGAGEMTVTYKQSDAVIASPISAGEYDIYVAVAEGDNYNAFEAAKISTLTIAKATPTVDLFTFTAPDDLTWDGNTKTATVTFDDQDGKLSGMGTITVKYNGSTDAPSAAGDYTVSIDVAEGDNYESATALTKDDWKFTITAPTPVSTTYLDENGETQNIDAWEVKDASEAVTWGTAGDTTWYVVKGEEVQLSAGAICAGDVRLILADNAKLTATGDNAAGIAVMGVNSLTIYGQSTGDEMGQLEATGGMFAAGIGGGMYGVGSNITINGGKVTAQGGGAGIGGGEGAAGSNIIINGGIVIAKGESGIGGGYDSPVSNNIYISDAYVLEAGEDADNTEVIAHSSAQDLGSTLTQNYVKIEGLATPYTRTTSVDQWATVCLPYAATSFEGADFYKVNYYDGIDKLYIEPVDNLVAGMPYIFHTTADVVTIEHNATAPEAVTAGNENGLYGSFARKTIAYDAEHAYAAIAGGAVNVVESGYTVTVPACRAYFDMDDVPDFEQPHSAPLRCISVPSKNPTDLEQSTIHNPQSTFKVLEDGQFVIIRDGKTYNAQGQIIQ